MVRKIKRRIRKQKIEKPNFKKPDPPPREESPSVGDRYLSIPSDVIRDLFSLAYAAGNVEISGVGTVSYNDDGITLDEFWMCSDIQELNDEIKESQEHVPRFVKKEKDGRVFFVENPEWNHRLNNQASSGGVNMDTAKVAKVIEEIVLRGDDPSSLRLYWHTHGTGCAFWSNDDLRAIENEVNMTGGNEIVNIVIAPGRILARVDSGLGKEKHAEALTVRMEEKYVKLIQVASVYQARFPMSDPGSSWGMHGWGWASGIDDRDGGSPDWDWATEEPGAGLHQDWREYLINQGARASIVYSNCPYCGYGKVYFEEFDIGDVSSTYCSNCGTVLDGELEGVQLL